MSNENLAKCSPTHTHTATNYLAAKVLSTVDEVIKVQTPSIIGQYNCFSLTAAQVSHALEAAYIQH